MKKILSLLCMASLVVCSISSFSVQAVETEKPCTEIAVPASEGLIHNYSLSVSNYNGSLRVDAKTFAPYNMEEIGVKDLTVQYSYDGNNWYDEWNSSNFLGYGTDAYTLSGYIIALERRGCYYRATCKHYAKESFWRTQTNSNTSSSVWIS